MNQDPTKIVNIQYEGVTKEAKLLYLGKSHDLGKFDNFEEAQKAGMKLARTLGYAGR